MSTSTGKAAIGCPSKPRHWRVIGLNGMVGYQPSGLPRKPFSGQKNGLSAQYDREVRHERSVPSQLRSCSPAP